MAAALWLDEGGAPNLLYDAWRLGSFGNPRNVFPCCDTALILQYGFRFVLFARRWKSLLRLNSPVHFIFLCVSATFR